MRIEQIAEYEIGPRLHEEITRLRNVCFPDHARDRSYFKQLPHFRYLAFEEGALVGQMGVDHRVISVGGTVARIFGVIDLCVSHAHQGKGIASQMLEQVTELAAAKGVDFLFLVADDQRLYRRNGFTPITAHLSWLRIDEHQNHGVASERIENELMIKRIGEKDWPGDSVDLLGYLF